MVFLNLNSNMCLILVRRFLSLLALIGDDSLVLFRIAYDQRYVKVFSSPDLSLYILDACAAVGIKPKITLIIVGKRHHIRYIPNPF